METHMHARAFLSLPPFPCRLSAFIWKLPGRAWEAPHELRLIQAHPLVPF